MKSKSFKKMILLLQVRQKLHFPETFYRKSRRSREARRRIASAYHQIH
jgi:hypothetical protein